MCDAKPDPVVGVGPRRPVPGVGGMSRRALNDSGTPLAALDGSLNGSVPARVGRGGGRPDPLDELDIPRATEEGAPPVEYRLGLGELAADFE